MADAASAAAAAAADDADAGGPPTLDITTDGRATPTLRRPRHLNRLHREDLPAPRRHVATVATVAADAGLRVLVLTGSGRACCAGFNRGEIGLSTHSAQSAADDPQLFECTVDALEGLRWPPGTPP